MNSNKYQTGKIYSLICDDGHYYIGSTISDLECRLSNHKYLSKKNKNRNVYKHINNIGWENVIIELVENYPCNTKTELNNREDYYIKEAKDNNDEFCLNINRALVLQEEKKENMKIYYENNKNIILERSQKYRNEHREEIKEYFKQHNIKRADKKIEYMKNYAIENKDKVIESRKKYYENNKDKVIKKNKEYVEKNREIVKERKKIWAEKNKEQIREKSKIKREENKEKIQEKGKQYYEENKELILQKFKEYREKNKETLNIKQAEYRAKRKEKIICDCGATHTLLTKAKHLKTKKHINYLTQNSYNE